MTHTIRENGPTYDDPYNPGPAEENPRLAYQGPVDPDRCVTYDKAAERIVLGAMLMSSDAIADIIEIIEPGEFYMPRHNTIFQAIIDMYSRGQPTDPVAVAGKLLDNGDHNRSGGAPYLHDCYTQVPVAANGSFYARRIAELALRRRLMEAAIGAAQAAGNAGKATEDVINEVELAIYTATRKREPGSGLQPISTMTNPTLDAIREAAARGSGLRGITTGFAGLDRMTSGLCPGNFVVVAGRPGMGKSTLAVDIARVNAIKHERPVGIFSLEMDRIEITTRILAAESKIPLRNLLTGDLTDDEWEHVEKVSERIAAAPLHIDETPSISMTEIRSKARRMKQQLGLRMLIIDYIQLMTPSGRKVENRQQEVAEISRSMKGLAKELEIPVIAVAQLNRLAEQRADKRPMLSDLRESGALEQDANIVIMVHRDDYYDKDSPRAGEADLIVAKNRGGQTGTAVAAAQLHLSRFVDMAA